LDPDSLTPLVKIKEFDILALIDTGASASFVSLEHILNFKIAYTKQFLGHCEIADGSKQRCFGSAMITFTMGSRTFSEKFFVIKNLNFNLVIGADFIRKYRVLPDIAGKKLWFLKQLSNSYEILPPVLDTEVSLENPKEQSYNKKQFRKNGKFLKRNSVRF